jgi:small subunit ribosomal protein S20
MPHIPVHPSAAKRHRQNLKRQERNRAIRTHARSAAKQALDAIGGADEAAAREQLREATRVLYKAASAGTLHRNTARRKVARLAASLSRKFAKPAAPAAQ